MKPRDGQKMGDSCRPKNLRGGAEVGVAVAQQECAGQGRHVGGELARELLFPVVSEAVDRGAERIGLSGDLNGRGKRDEQLSIRSAVPPGADAIEFSGIACRSGRAKNSEGIEMISREESLSIPSNDHSNPTVDRNGL